MLILVLDSCGASCAVGLWRDGRMLAQHQESMERGQDARLMPMVVSIMEKAQLSFSDLDKIAVPKGPGSFTGVRVCLAAARGLGLAARKPVIGVDRFSLYHWLHKEEGKDLLVVIQSKREQLFCKFFSRDGKFHEAVLMTESEIKDFLSHHPNADKRDDGGEELDTLLACAEIAARASEKDPVFSPEPLYLRAPDVTMPIAKSG